MGYSFSNLTVFSQETIKHTKFFFGNYLTLPEIYAMTILMKILFRVMHALEYSSIFIEAKAVFQKHVIVDCEGIYHISDNFN